MEQRLKLRKRFYNPEERLNVILVDKSEDSSHMESMNRDNYVPRHPNNFSHTMNQILSNKQPYENS